MMFVDRWTMFGFLILSIPLFLALLYKLLDTRYYSLRKPKGNLDKTNNKEQVDVDNLWSELDPNLLGEILGRLCFADQLRFHIVCKNWLHVHPSTPIRRKPLLWYLSFDRSLYELQLHDPSSPDSASVKNISLSELAVLSPSSYKEVSATILNFNWLLNCLVKPRLFFWKRRYIFLFSLFTNKLITLPKIDCPGPFKYLIFTYSTQPDSPDCVFFLVDTCGADDKVTILTYRNGDKEWTAKQFYTVTDFVHCSCKIVNLGGILYIVSPYGQLASYNIVDGKSKFECLFVDELFRLNMNSGIYRYRVVELNGELMMIHFIPREKKNVMLLRKPYIRRYDWSSKDWIPISTLGDKTLLFGEKNSLIGYK